MNDEPIGSAEALPVAPVEAAPVAREPLGAGRALLLYLVYLSGQLAVGVVVGFGAGLLGALEDGTGLLPLIVVLAALLGVVTGAWLVLILATRWSSRAAGGLASLEIGWALGTPRQLLLACGAGMLIGVLAVGFIGWASARGSEPTLGPVMNAAQQPGLVFAAWIVLTMLVAPPIEELLFRGLMLRGFTRSWGPFAAGLCVTAMFVASHTFESGGYLPALLMIAAMGCATIAARSATGALGPAIALHASYNGVIMLATGLARG